MGYVTIEIAKKLKAKGYPQGNPEDISEVYYSILDPLESAIRISNGEDVKWYCPHVYDVRKWMREQGIDIWVTPAVFRCDEDGNKTHEYECEVITPKMNKPVTVGYYDEYEQAEMAGVEYVLDEIMC